MTTTISLVATNAAATAGAVTGAALVGNAEHFGFLWQCAGCLAGGLTALYFQPWRGLSWSERVFSIMVAGVFALFVTPMVFAIHNTRDSGGFFYMMATGAFVLIPFAIKKLKANVGGKLSGDTE